MPKEQTCKCNWGYMVVAWVLITIAIFLLVGGFTAQFNAKADYLTILGWYFVGLLVFFLGKMAKHKACGSCGMHMKK